MRKSCLSAVLLAFLCVALLPLLLSAQEHKSTVTGRVTDTTHAVLRGARVELQPNGPNAVSDSDGQFTLSGVAPGKYTLTVSYMGFATFSQDVAVNAGQTVNVDAVLQIQRRSETVEVRAERE